MKKKVRILQTIEHPKGNVEKDSIYNWDEELNLYVLKNEEGIIFSTVNKPMVDAMPQLFEYAN